VDERERGHEKKLLVVSNTDELVVDVRESRTASGKFQVTNKQNYQSGDFSS
jgi:hypothetical protein